MIKLGPFLISVPKWSDDIKFILTSSMLSSLTIKINAERERERGRGVCKSFILTAA
jgi:hypothetical protein